MTATARFVSLVVYLNAALRTFASICIGLEPVQDDLSSADRTTREPIWLVELFFASYLVLF